MVTGSRSLAPRIAMVAVVYPEGSVRLPAVLR